MKNGYWLFNGCLEEYNNHFTLITSTELFIEVPGALFEVSSSKRRGWPCHTSITKVNNEALIVLLSIQKGPDFSGRFFILCSKMADIGLIDYFWMSRPTYHWKPDIPWLTRTSTASPCDDIQNIFISLFLLKFFLNSYDLITNKSVYYHNSLFTADSIRIIKQ